ncbi:hypothetical protein BKA93DRAFT_500477 [Sparassis latifolia]|uniref:RING-type domain-containing protein n=1 Tax=Sparassis crispa TaxID=139825 RepID=A0A401H541_9APHY|nr:hypothetical protein SCP_1601830 [Sparassis crispa]GBE89521.1 hypothetical protein SCP_1601830 [Sparassis crispa]
MPTCFVCLDTLTDPAALPCGHVFCHGCIVRVVRNITPYTHHHFCPTCKQPYVISQVDPSLVPPHLRQHVSPAVRKLHLDYTAPHTLQPSSPSSVPNTECDRLRAENAALKATCIVWRKRAAVHATATLGLVGLARLARDSALKMKSERDFLESRYNALKRSFEESQTLSTFPPQPDHRVQSAFEDLRESSFRPPSPAASDDSYCSDCPKCQSPKRKRDASPMPSPKRTRSESFTGKASPTSPSLEMAALVV